MKKGVFLLVLGLSFTSIVRAEWADLSSGLKDTDIRTVAVDAVRPRVIYAASERRLYRWDGAKEWKQLLALKGSGASIHDVMADSAGAIYVASDRGIQRSADGKKWQTLYRGFGDIGKTVFCLLEDARHDGRLWAGSDESLLLIHTKTGEVRKVEGFPRAPVRSLAGDGALRLWAGTDQGIYKSDDSGEHWRRVQAQGEVQEEARETLSQFAIEEMTSMPMPAALVYLPEKDELYASTVQGVLRGLEGGERWERAASELRADDLAASSTTLYAATEKGAFVWDEKQGLKDISEGLASKEVHQLIYDPSSGDLIAATRKGVFRYPKPEFRFSPVSMEMPPTPDAMQVLRQFSHEPAIRQVQDAAIHYAEVHPDKIKAWREAAARKAWLPTLSMSADTSDDQNIDLDRGGTNDPDKFIEGPKENSRDWHMGLSWDLSEIVWNNDQTSIDTRSRLLVELRDDVLTDVTHLYFERRRLQVEMRMAPARDLPLQVERQLKLDELTAGIDALTGGYFSDHLPPSQDGSFHVEVSHG